MKLPPGSCGETRAMSAKTEEKGGYSMRMPPKSRKTPASNDESPLFELLLRERTEALCGCDPQPALLRD